MMPHQRRSPLTQMIARLLFAPALIIALGTMIKGYADTGDGFAAGVIAALAVLLQLIAFGHEEVVRTLPLGAAPLTMAVGLLLSLAVAFVPTLFGRPIMTQFPPPGAPVMHFGTLELLTAVLFDVGVFLLVLGFSVTTMRLVANIELERRLP